MRLLVFALDGAPPERLMSDERCASVRGLAARACYGPLIDAPVEADAFWRAAGLGETPELWPLVREVGGSLRQYAIAADNLDAALLAFDAELTRVLENLDAETLFVLLARGAGAPSALFVIADAHMRVAGEVSDARVADLAPTLIELTGAARRASAGQSLVGRGGASAGYSADDEAVIRERLSGLGYI
ncbi:MAG: hypothetical protein U1D55_12750 [Phycisphaerae bacterium]